MKDEKSLVSIIIPAYNEEEYIGSLLNSLLKQADSLFEIIVSDGFSSDSTMLVVNQYVKQFKKMGVDLKFVQSEKKSPGKQRNYGVKFACGERLLFLDSDVILEENFLSNAIAEIRDKKYDLAQGYLLPRSTRKRAKFLFQGMNWTLDKISKHYPTAGTQALFSLKSVHEKINGFNDNLLVGDDADYVMRMSKAGYRVGILMRAVAYVSLRRIRKEGYMRTVYYSLYHAFLFGVMGFEGYEDKVKRKYDLYELNIKMSFRL